MESRGGKLAPGRDGLTFYHVNLDPHEHNFVLEADMTIHQFGPETGASPSGQESAGFMVRDLIGRARQDPMLDGFEEVPAASNYASTTVLRQGAVAMTRTGVTEPRGSVGSERRTETLGSYGVLLETPIRNPMVTSAHPHQKLLHKNALKGTPPPLPSRASS